MRGYLIAAAAGLLLALALVVGVKWYGRHEYAAGQAQAQLEAQAAAAKLSEQYRAQEQATQQQAEENYAKYRGQVLATQKRAADLDAAAGRLRAQLASLQSRRAAAHSAASAGADAAAGPDVIGVIAACAGRYDEVVRYAASLADQVTGLQGYVRAALGAR
ncbi:hypothetical protein [Bordetella bronchialis]|uniref:Lysozyme n=1 Tax=Bordetella bronchialis TaxID=463025 RepID=A0ABM6CR40_9BORD|nr:hypothetical protein [Bordetella bronchialis]ANN66482.1 hypothetical protein BAU06_09400 [Bordetella bronchialis]